MLAQRHSTFPGPSPLVRPFSFCSPKACLLCFFFNSLAQLGGGNGPHRRQKLWTNTRLSVARLWGDRITLTHTRYLPPAAQPWTLMSSCQPCHSLPRARGGCLPHMCRVKPLQELFYFFPQVGLLMPPVRATVRSGGQCCASGPPSFSQQGP